MVTVKVEAATTAVGTCSEEDLDANTVTDTDELVIRLRQAMVRRQPEVSLRINGAHLTLDDAWDILDLAMAHTGVPEEGDYLRVNMGSRSVSLETGSDSLGQYTQMTVSFNWFTDAAMEEEIDAAVDALLAELDLWDATNYEKVKGVYDWVTENVQYDFDNVDDTSYTLMYTPYAALVNNIAVC